MTYQPSYQSSSQTTSKLLNYNKNSSRYFNNINEKSVYKKYINTKANSNKCSRNNKCKKQTSKHENKNKLTKSKAKIGLQTLSYGYKKKLKSILTNMIGLIKSTISKKEIVDIANYLDILNKVYNEPICESGMTMTATSEYRNNSYSRITSRNSKSIDIYQYLIKQMIDKLANLAPEKISLFINNIKNSNKTTTNSKAKTDLAYEDIMNNNNNLKSVFKSVLETLPVCKTS
jgi:hypothetical protein